MQMGQIWVGTGLLSAGVLLFLLAGNNPVPTQIWPICIARV